MEPPEFKKKLVRGASATKTSSRLVNTVRRFPRAHIIAVSALTLCLAAITSLPSEPAQASRQTIELALPKLKEHSVEQVLSQQIPLPQDAHTEAHDHRIINEVVKSGDNLSLIFARAGLNDTDMFAFVRSSQEAKEMAQIYPGHTLTFEISSDQQLLSLRHQIDRLTCKIFTFNGETFDYQKQVKSPDVKMAIRSGTITSSLYNAGIDAGLDEQLIMELAGIFGWDVDFALDIRQGDSFRLIYEEKFLDGERLGAGNILAAEFVNQNTSFKAVRYVDQQDRAQYYSPSGNAMEKAFLRAPLDFRRISSNFNPKRLHPVTKTVKPHRGTDYAANRGTPVWASGDGRVIASAYNASNGNYVVIQHGGEIQTKYLHLSKRKVKKGDRVKQKQIIGTVGSTGLSTAPHLHYEFLLNGVHRNPRTIVQKLPKAEAIATSEMQRFLAQTQPVMAQLEKTTRVAVAEDATKSL